MSKAILPSKPRATVLRRDTSTLTTSISSRCAIVDSPKRHVKFAADWQKQARYSPVSQRLQARKEANRKRASNKMFRNKDSARNFGTIRLKTSSRGAISATVGNPCALHGVANEEFRRSPCVTRLDSYFKGQRGGLNWIILRKRLLNSTKSAPAKDYAQRSSIYVGGFTQCSRTGDAAR